MTAGDANSNWAQRRGGGQVLLTIGIAGASLGLLQRLGAPVPYYCGEWLLILLFLATAVAGAALTWRGDHPRTVWTPSTPGRRFRTAVLYTRHDCPLCDDAHELLTSYADYLPEIVPVDVDEDPRLQELYGESVPVLVLDDRVRFRGPVSEGMLRRLIEGTEPTPR